MKKTRLIGIFGVFLVLFLINFVSADYISDYAYNKCGIFACDCFIEDTRQGTNHICMNPWPRNYCEGNLRIKECLTWHKAGIFGSCKTRQSGRVAYNCGSDYCESWSSNYCIGNNIYHSRTCHDKGCSQNTACPGGICGYDGFGWSCNFGCNNVVSCFDNTYNDEQKVTSCGIKDCDTLDTECTDYNDIQTSCSSGSCIGSCTSYNHLPAETPCGGGGFCNGYGGCVLDKDMDGVLNIEDFDLENPCSKYNLNDNCGQEYCDLDLDGDEFYTDNKENYGCDDFPEDGCSIILLTDNCGNIGCNKDTDGDSAPTNEDENYGCDDFPEDGCSIYYEEDNIGEEGCLGVINNTYWADMAGNPINTSEVNDFVLLVAEGSFPKEYIAKFSIFEDDIEIPFLSGDEPITNVFSSFSDGKKATASWKVYWVEDFEGPEYYFKVELMENPEIGRQSGILKIPEEVEYNSQPIVEIGFPNYDRGESYVLPTNASIQFLSFSYDEDDQLSYLWDFGNGDTSEEKDPVYVYLENESGKHGGPTIITLKITDSRNLTNSTSIKVLINSSIDDPPLAIISSPKDGMSIFGNKVFCDATLSIDDLTPFENINFTWTFDDGDPAHQKIKGIAGALFNKTYLFAGYHEVILEVNDEGPVDESTKYFETKIKTDEEDEKIKIGEYKDDEKIEQKSTILIKIIIILVTIILLILIIYIIKAKKPKSRKVKKNKKKGGLKTKNEK